MTFSSSDKVGDIVAQLPQASQLFSTLKIDFCCGGNRPLSEAARDKGIEVDGLVSDLNALARLSSGDDPQSERDWTQAPLEDLVQHILSRHHAYLQTALPELSGLVTKILRVHGTNHGELSGLHRVFHELKVELEQHIAKEEMAIFPHIVTFAQTGSTAALSSALGAIRILEAEHETAGQLLKAIRSLTGDFTPPADACGTYRLTFTQLEALESDTFMHIHLENNVLFPRLRLTN